MNNNKKNALMLFLRAFFYMAILFIGFIQPEKIWLTIYNSIYRLKAAGVERKHPWGMIPTTKLFAPTLGYYS
jgi:hypothetical protein